MIFRTKALTGTFVSYPRLPRAFHSSSSTSSNIKDDKNTKNGNESYLPQQDEGATETVTSSDSIDVTTTTKKISWSMDWRKIQLDHLQDKFQNDTVKDDDQLQSNWKEMESRVTRRPPPKKSLDNKPTGRNNIKKTDEEIWLQQGMYDNDDSTTNPK